MPDLFDVFRWLLGTVVTVYATVVTCQWIWTWWVWLTRPQAGYERQFALLRRYLMLHGLRLRLARFGGDILVIIGLSIVFLLLFQAHLVVYDTPRVQEYAVGDTSGTYEFDAPTPTSVPAPLTTPGTGSGAD